MAKLPWQWTNLSIDSPDTYIPFDRDILLTVPASLQSTTTRCLLAEGDWFERELEFWRQYLQPGMVVIDIGASFGVYTFSAAIRVGVNGMIYAIKPLNGIDLATAEYLIDRGYQLFRYQPYLQQLILLVNQSDFVEVIKAIALHAGYANAIPQSKP